VKIGETVAAFERAFAEYVGAKYAIALVNGTATLHTALVALGVRPGNRVAVPPLTMASTTIAVLHAGAVPVFCDVDERTWIMHAAGMPLDWDELTTTALLPVSLYGLHAPFGPPDEYDIAVTDDAAQTLRRHSGCAFTSYSFQASKILALGEGGMLVTNDEALATNAREFSSLGYRLAPDQPRIDPKTLKSPDFQRHHSLGWNYRMNDTTAAFGLRQLARAEFLKEERHDAASCYRNAIAGCNWLTPQHVPNGSTHDYWTFAVATDTPERCLALLDAVEAHGGERPYPAWRLTYHESPFRHLVSPVNVETVPNGGHYFGYPRPDGSGTIRTHPFGEPGGICPIAESLQPRLLQMQTNNLASAARNAAALRKAIAEEPT
jgi:perosamine synthetase